ncbi:MAG: methyltransferase domain-containing protein [Acetobacterales bacterium]
MKSLDLHAQRLAAVDNALQMADAKSMLDLGCGSGPLLRRLALGGRIRRIVGVDTSSHQLRLLSQWLAQSQVPETVEIELVNASVTEIRADWSGFDAAVLIELIEHLAPDRLSRIEKTVFGHARPRTVIVTTPNRDCNALLGVPARRLRHSDHKFEWSREKFGGWSTGVARRNGYEIRLHGIGVEHPGAGAPTQMAVFTRRTPA